MNEVYELNAIARRLLAFLHRYALQHPGRPFGVAPNEETFREAVLDRAGYDKAQGRLYQKGFAKPSGSGHHPGGH